MFQKLRAMSMKQRAIITTVFCLVIWIEVDLQEQQAQISLAPIKIVVIVVLALQLLITSLHTWLMAKAEAYDKAHPKKGVD